MPDEPYPPFRRVFHGRDRRVVIETTYGMSISVYSLPADAHPSTAYRCKLGRQHYHGDDLDAAWGILKRIAPAAQWPAGDADAKRLMAEFDRRKAAGELKE